MASAVRHIQKFHRFIRNSRGSFGHSIKSVDSTHTYQFHRCSINLGSTSILMPSLSPTMTEGTIVKWYKKEGDAINAGDILCDIQTDKAVVSFDTEEAGIMAKILVPENTSEIKVGTLIAIAVEDGDDWRNVAIPASPVSTPVTSAPPPVATPAQSSAVTPASMAVGPGMHEDLQAHGIGPSVRKLAEEFGVSIKNIKGSGPLNRITKGDVLKLIQEGNLQKRQLSPPPQAPASAPQMVATQTTATPTATPTVTPLAPYKPSVVPEIDGEEYKDIPNTGMRNTIAKRLTLSKTTIPHSYVTMDCNVGPVTSLRKNFIADNVKVSVNDFIIKSAALALQRVPQVNSVWQGDEALSLLNVDISVAVATDNGLITPIVKNTAQLSVDKISSTVRDLAERARANKLQLHEFQGGTFTISNLGMFGIGEFSAVINPPQTAILAIGSSRLVLGENGKPESRMSVTLSYDARVIDDSDASKFLEVFRDTMENPQLLVSGLPGSRRESVF